MNLKPVNRIPTTMSRNVRSNNNRLQMIIMEFYESTHEFAEVEFDYGEYANIYSMYSGIKKAILALDIPIAARMVHGKVYLERE